MAPFVSVWCAETDSLPVFTVQPYSQAAVPGGSVLFSVTVNGPGSSTFQWRLNGTNVSSATNATLSLSNVQLSDQGFYSVLARNSAGLAASEQAYLLVYDGAVATAGGAVWMANGAPGVNAPIYDGPGFQRLRWAQWFVQLYAGVTNNPFSFAPIGLPTGFRRGTSAGYFQGEICLIPNVPPGSTAYVQARLWSIYDGRTYEEAFADYQAGGAEGLGWSGVVQLTTGSAANPAYLVGLQSFQPSPPEVIYSNSPAQTARVGDAVSFIPSRAGTNHVWCKDGVPVQGANQATLTLANILPSDVASYCVRYYTTDSFRFFVEDNFGLAVPAPLRFAGLVRAENGDIRTAVSGVPGDVISLQSSSDFVNWQTVAIATNSVGIVEVVDSSARDSGQRFYRAALEP